MEISKTVALYCSSCQKLIAVVPVRKFDRVYVPYCPHCVTETEVITLPSATLSATEETC